MQLLQKCFVERCVDCHIQNALCDSLARYCVRQGNAE